MGRGPSCCIVSLSRSSWPIRTPVILAVQVVRMVLVKWVVQVVREVLAVPEARRYPRTGMSPVVAGACRA